MNPALMTGRTCRVTVQTITLTLNPPHINNPDPTATPDTDPEHPVANARTIAARLLEFQATLAPRGPVPRPGPEPGAVGPTHHLNAEKGRRNMRVQVYKPINPGVFTTSDAIGIECCKPEQELSGGIVHIATGGSVLAECLVCNKHWHLQDIPTHDNGPILGLSAKPMPLTPLRPPEYLC